MLQNLSLEYENLSQVYPSFVDVVDEVIGDFDETFKTLPRLIEQNKISIKAVVEILKCKNLIDLIFTMEDKMSDDCFRTCQEWKILREHARNAYDLIINTDK